MWKPLARTLARLFRTEGANPARRAVRQTTSLRLESLEARDVPAVGLADIQTLTPILHNGVLTITGNDSANVINVGYGAGHIWAMGQAFNPWHVRYITIDSRGGNDTINISPNIPTTSFIYGGWGNDTILGGCGRDVIYGGTGNDSIYGRGGNDIFYSGGGSDTMQGGTGVDVLRDLSAGDRAYHTIYQPVGSTRTNFNMSTYNGQVLNYILYFVNRERRLNGLAALTLDNRLNTVADTHARVMAALRVPVGQGMSHSFSGSIRPLLSSRMDSNQLNYTSAGENNGWLKVSPLPPANWMAWYAMYGFDGNGGWMNSSGHRANILSGNFTHIGIGMGGNATVGYYFTQNFARY